MIFSNYKTIANSEAKKMLLGLVDKAIGCVQPKRFIPKSVKLRGDVLRVKNKKFSVKNKRVFVIGAGKASAEMALEIEKIFGTRRITDGIVITNKTNVKLNKIKLHLADHPIPSVRGLRGAQKVFGLKKKYCIGKNDLIIALISGGGSALMPYPVSGISLVDKKKLYNLFIKYGVAGYESTIIKTKISRVKGGGLAGHFFPAQVISLVLSDDNGQAGDEFTASGPCTPHDSTFADALRVVDKYKMRRDVPNSIIAFLEKNKNKDARESDAKDVSQFILASNKILLAEISGLAREKRYSVSVQSGVAGETKEVACAFCGQIKKIGKKRRRMLMYGGETTVNLPKKHGFGGRNQEFAVACIKYLQDVGLPKQWALISFATDGVDFIKQSAGGIIGDDSLGIVNSHNIDESLEKHDSHRLLKMVNANMSVGDPTGTNVGDIMIYVQL